MIKTLSRILKQDKERFVIPKGIQQVIPIRAIWQDGIFLLATSFLNPIALRILTMPWHLGRIRRRCSYPIQSCLIPLTAEQQPK